MMSKGQHRTQLLFLAILIALIVVAASEAVAGPTAPGANAGWEEIGAGSASGGGISNTTGKSRFSNVAVGPDGMPVVAWLADRSGTYRVYVRRWDGTTWAEMGSGSASDGGISNNVGDWQNPALAIGPDGMPVVAWAGGSNISDGDIYVRRWDGTTWAEIGAGSASGGGISHDPFDSQNPSLAIGPDGIPVVAWAKYGRNGAYAEVYVRRWDGAAWAEMDAGSATGGGISNTKMDSWRPSLAIGPVGAPVVTWFDNSSDKYQIYVRRYRSVPGATFRAFTPAVIFEAQPDAGASGD